MTVADPQEIERQIETARAELTVTIEALAERLSPGRVKTDAARKVKESARHAYEKALFKPAPASMIDGQPAHDADTTTYAAGRQLRWERVGAAAGVVTVLIVLRRVRKKREAAREAEAAAAAAALPAWLRSLTDGRPSDTRGSAKKAARR